MPESTVKLGVLRVTTTVDRKETKRRIKSKYLLIMLQVNHTLWMRLKTAAVEDDP